jgi:L-lysine exporter family protein LysE/ArgO
MPLVQGLILGTGLCCSVGPQSLFVFRQGIRGEAAVLVALLCTLVDFALIVIALVGADAIVTIVPDAEGIAAWAAGGFILAYACFTLAAAARKTGDVTEPAKEAAALAAIVIATLALSLLNPQVYLEVVVMVGLVGLHFPAGERWLFGLGVALISPLWFFGLAYFGGRIAPLMSRPSVLRTFDVAISLVMIGLAIAIFWGVASH